MPLLKSWVESANSAEHPFPLNNLPYGVFSVDDGDLRCGIAIGDRILTPQGLRRRASCGLTPMPMCLMRHIGTTSWNWGRMSGAATAARCKPCLRQMPQKTCRTS